MGVYAVGGTELNSIYNKNEDSLETGYDVEGNVIFTNDPQAVVDYSSYTASTYLISYCKQGFAIYGDYLFALDKTDECRIIKISTDEVLQTVQLTMGHGNSGCWGRFLNQNDEFPLLYVSHDLGAPSSHNYEYVYRITRNGNVFTFDLVQTIKLFYSQAGYMADSAIDTQNNILYMLGYSKNTATSDSDGTNTMILTSWNLNNLSDNADGTVSPIYLRKIITDFFIYAHGNHAYHDGMVWTTSGENNGFIYAINPSDGTLAHKLNLLQTGEGEGIAWISANEAIIGYYQSNFYKYTFEIEES